jgi:hypothetical protein
MPEPIILSDEQFAMLKRLEAETARFTESEALRSNEAAIDLARKLIDEAVALKMPVQAYYGLQIYVNMYDIDKDLPRA